MASARNAPTTVPPARPRKLRRGPLTRKQILDASLKLFSEKGFARTSVRDIAQVAGITDAAIYYHFSSKRDLFEALIEERGFAAALDNLERAEITVGPREAIQGIAMGGLGFIYANRDLMKVLMVEAMAQDPVATEEYRILAERWVNAEARILRHYAEHGHLRTEAIDQLATQLVLTVLGVLADYLMKPASEPAPDSPPADLVRYVEMAMQHIVQGIT
jgi:AcrR family transcriptional regulator